MQEIQKHENYYTIVLPYYSSTLPFRTTKGVVKGRVFDSKNNEPIPFANVVIWKTSIGTAADENGYFRIENVPLGFNRLEVSSIGYTTKLSEEFMVNTASERTVNVDLEESQVNLEQVMVKANPFRKAVESPVSLQRIRDRRDRETRVIEIYRKYYNPCRSPFLSRFQK